MEISAITALYARTHGRKSQVVGREYLCFDRKGEERAAFSIRYKKSGNQRRKVAATVGLGISAVRHLYARRGAGIYRQTPAQQRATRRRASAGRQGVPRQPAASGGGGTCHVSVPPRWVAAGPTTPPFSVLQQCRFPSGDVPPPAVAARSTCRLRNVPPW